MKAIVLILALAVVHGAIAKPWYSALFGGSDSSESSVSSESSNAYQQPPFCGNYECPEYKVIKKFNVSQKNNFVEQIFFAMFLLSRYNV